MASPAGAFQAISDTLVDKFDERRVPDELVESLAVNEHAWFERVDAATAKSSVTHLDPSIRRNLLIFLREACNSLCISKDCCFLAAQVIDTNWFRICPVAFTQDLFALCAAALFVADAGTTTMQLGRSRAIAQHLLTMATYYSTHLGGRAVSREDVYEKELALLATLSSPPTPSTWISTFVARLDVTTRGVIADLLDEVKSFAEDIAERSVFVSPASRRQSPRTTGLGCVGLALVAFGLLPDDRLQPSLAAIATRQNSNRLEPQVVVAAIQFATRCNMNELLLCMRGIAACVSTAGHER